MPHTRSKKKRLAQLQSLSQEPSSSSPPFLPSNQPTKRQQILSEDGWTHIITTPRHKTSLPNHPAYPNPKNRKAPLRWHMGDFQIGEVGYVHRTLEELRGEWGFYERGWLEGGDGVLGGILREGNGELDSGDGIVKLDEIGERDKEQELEGKGMNEKADGRTDDNGRAVNEGKSIQEQKSKRKRKQIKNVVVLGLGSLQSARREGRRASWTQLIALTRMLHYLDPTPTTPTTPTTPIPYIFQDPQFTPLDKEFLHSLGHTVVEDPDAFSKIDGGTLVYAVHCYADVYGMVARREGGRWPALFVGTDVECFGRGFGDEKNEAIVEELRKMVSGCEVFDFPQVRHDFSDTKIYWRNEFGLDNNVEESDGIDEGREVDEVDATNATKEANEVKEIKEANEKEPKSKQVVADPTDIDLKEADGSATAKE